jgi:hypothetical protein
VAEAIGAVFRGAREGDEKVRKRIGKVGLLGASLYFAIEIVGLARDALRARPPLGSPAILTASFAHPELVIGMVVIAGLCLSQLIYLWAHERRELQRQALAEERMSRDIRERDEAERQRHETLMRATQQTHAVALAAIRQPELTKKVAQLEGRVTKLEGWRDRVEKQTTDRAPGLDTSTG